MSLFRKKPVVIEAMHYDGTEKSFDLIWAWCCPSGSTLASPIHSEGCGHEPGGLCNLVIKTLEGEMKALPGDWIIKGTAGEFYPCKPEVFAQVYEAVPAAPSPKEEKP